jgi:hypothetical protein
MKKIAQRTDADRNARELAKVMDEGIIQFATPSFPVFGPDRYDDANPPASVTCSPYYWWFKFLQLNDEYAAAGSKPSSKYADVFAELGDVRTTDFKSWWDEHAFAFAEPISEYEMIVARRSRDLAPFDDPDAINLVVPMTWDRKTLLRRFKAIVLSQIPEARPGVDVSGSKARFKLSGRWNVLAMERAYNLYVMRGSFQGLPLPDLLDLAGVNQVPAKSADSKTRPEISDERRRAGIRASRHHKRALAYIEAAATHEFPHPTTVK